MVSDNKPRIQTQGHRQLCYPDILETGSDLIVFDVSEPFKDDALLRFVDKTQAAILSSPADLKFVKDELLADNPHLTDNPALSSVVEQVIRDFKVPKEGWRRKHSEYFADNFGQMGWQWAHGSHGTEPVKYKVNEFLIKTIKDLNSQQATPPESLRHVAYITFKRLNPDLETADFLNSFQHCIEQCGLKRVARER